MLFRASVRNTAVQLLRAAMMAASADEPRLINADTKIEDQISCVADNPNWSGHGPFISVTVEDKKQSVGAGGSPTFITRVTVTVSIRAEGKSQDDARYLVDLIGSIVERALLGGQGWSLVVQTTAGSLTSTPSSIDGLIEGMSISGDGVGIGNCIESIDASGGTIQLARTAASTGTFRVLAGSFVGLFEAIDSVDDFNGYDGQNQAYHVWSSDIEITAHVTEIFEPVVSTDLTQVRMNFGLNSSSDPDVIISEGA
jgi:hypothetical protein